MIEKCNNRALRVAAVIPAFIWVVMVFCSNSGDIAGTTNTGNARIVARYPDSQPVAEALVRVRFAAFLSDTNAALAKAAAHSFDTRTDHEGVAIVPPLDLGAYRVEITDQAGSAVMLGLSVDTRGVKAETDTAVLAPVAILKGTATPGAMVRVAGLERAVRVGPDSTYALHDMPAGEHRVVVTTQGLTAIIDSVHAGTGDTITLPYAGWRYNALYPLPAAFGDGLTGEVYDFPLLLRFSLAYFDTLSDIPTAPGHADLRFTSESGIPLSYEIEQWDNDSRVADIWLRLDTLRWGNDPQYVRVYWGNPAVVSGSDGTAVFDTASGFISVWHLACGQQNHDATSNRIDLAPQSGNHPLPAKGIAGCGAYYDGIGDGHTFSHVLFDSTSVYARTISLWYFADSTAQTQILYEQGGLYAGMNIYLHQDTLFAGAWFPQNDSTWSCYLHTIAASGAWHHVALVYDRRSSRMMRLYHDGIPVDSVSVAKPVWIHPARNALGMVSEGTHLHTGEESNRNYFRGVLDEVRVESVARPPWWIELCYRNQVVR